MMHKQKVNNPPHKYIQLTYCIVTILKERRQNNHIRAKEKTNWTVAQGSKVLSSDEQTSCISSSGDFMKSGKTKLLKF